MSGPDPVPAALDGYIREAIRLRMLAEVPPVTPDPAELQRHLLDARGRQDRVEELLRVALRVRARAQRASHAASAEAKEAFDAAIHRQRSTPVQTGGEFISAREREAEANLATIDLHRAARRAAELTHVCDEAVEVIRSTYWGLSGVREDIRELLRSTAFESHLER